MWDESRIDCKLLAPVFERVICTENKVLTNVVPEVSVIQWEQVLFGVTVCKECEDCFFSKKIKKKTQFS